MTLFERLETIHICVGICLNSLLLLLIIRFSSPAIGGYKYLLAIFSCYGIYLSTLHALLNPVQKLECLTQGKHFHIQKIMIVDKMYGMAMYSRLQSPFSSVLYITSFAIPFALLDIHFLYRYWTVKGSPRMELFTKPWFIFALVTYPLSQTVVSMTIIHGVVVENSEPGLQSVLAAFQLKFNDTIECGWMLMDYVKDGQLNVRVILILVMAVSISGLNFNLAILLALRSLKFLREARRLSPALGDLQIRFFIAACIQTFVPFFLVCLPFSVLLFFTPLGMSGEYRSLHF